MVPKLYLKHTKSEPPSKPGSGLKICGGWVGGVQTDFSVQLKV